MLMLGGPIMALVLYETMEGQQIFCCVRTEVGWMSCASIYASLNSIFYFVPLSKNRGVRPL